MQIAEAGAFVLLSQVRCDANTRRKNRWTLGLILGSVLGDPMATHLLQPQ